jgi:hypothetical protein
MPHPYDLSKFTNDELCDIHTTLNRDIWDSRLGYPPIGYANLPEDRMSVFFRNKRSRLDVHISIMDEIKRLVGEKAVEKHWFIHAHGYSEEAFEDYWQRYRAFA